MLTFLHTKSAIFLPIFCRYKLYAYGMALYIVKIYVYASELENIGFLHTKSAIFFNILSVIQIFCRYK